MKTKLVFVINSLHGGGAERVVSTLCNCLSKGTFQITIICLNTKEHSYQMAEDIKVITLTNRKDSENIFLRIWYAIVTFWKLLTALKQEKPKGAVSFMTSANLWTGVACWIVGVPYFVSERTTPDKTIHQLNSVIKWLSFKVYSKSRAIIVPSQGIEECFRKNKLFDSLNNYRTIHNPVSPFKRSDAPEVYPYPFILGVGRLTKIKGFDILIDAFSKLGDENIHLLISGEGPERQNLQQQIEKLGLEKQVKLIGFKNNIHDYYQQADIFVLPSRNEGYPNALVEAMSCGCAVVAADCEFGPSEIIVNEKNGLLVKAHSAVALSNGISTLLNNPILKFQISQNAILINQTNSLDAIACKWENLILSHV